MAPLNLVAATMAVVAAVTLIVMVAVVIRTSEHEESLVESASLQSS
jgi:hypothetical protein